MSTTTAKPSEREGFVYMLATWDGGRPRTYVGWTYDVDARLARHNAGQGAKATKGRAWRVIHVESHPSKQAAMSAEYALKKDRPRRSRLSRQALIRG
ncbi:GIY-YIG nuclease family protein [Salipiger mucosus]|uniref:GIY-YIG nuclease family protein n=1 Tax=Salipiger mucosus TaxID=263378 RepID=UPI0018DD3CF5|nr:GIY-YIG nuclease family protein [Salipiger mucosus]